MPSEKLEFTKQEPAFLRKLREQHGGPRNNVQIARPKKDRLRTGDEDEDEPVIVDESGENVAKEEWEGMLKREKEGEADDKTPGDSQRSFAAEGSKHDGGPRGGQKIADTGVSKKRKAAKIIVNHETEAEGTGGLDDEPSSESTTKQTATKADSSPGTTKPKKKARKIKLSFDEPE